MKREEILKVLLDQGEMSEEMAQRVAEKLASMMESRESKSTLVIRAEEIR